MRSEASERSRMLHFAAGRGARGAGRSGCRAGAGRARLVRLPPEQTDKVVVHKDKVVVHKDKVAVHKDKVAVHKDKVVVPLTFSFSPRTAASGSSTPRRFPTTRTRWWHPAAAAAAPPLLRARFRMQDRSSGPASLSTFNTSLSPPRSAGSRRDARGGPRGRGRARRRVAARRAPRDLRRENLRARAPPERQRALYLRAPRALLETLQGRDSSRSRRYIAKTSRSPLRPGLRLGGGGGGTAGSAGAQRPWSTHHASFCGPSYSCTCSGARTKRQSANEASER